MLRRLGDLTAEECEAARRPRATRPSRCWQARARAPRRQGADRRRGALDRRRGRRPLPRRARGAAARRPARLLPRGGRPTRWWRWSAATRAPTARSRPRRSPRRYGVDPTPALKELERAGELVRGELLPGGTEREWCDADVLRRVRRASLAAPAQGGRGGRPPPSSPASCPRWQNVDAHRPAGAGPDRLREALVPLQGVALTPEVWERDVLPRRLGAYSPTWLDQLTTGGELVWIGAGPLGRTGRVALYFREDVRLAGPAAREREARAPRGRGPRRDPRAARRRRPAFWLDLVADLELRARGAARGALGPRLGRRGDQRRLRAAARAAADGGRSASGARGRRFALAPQRRRPGGARGAGR